jgi:hypothetical protein
MTESEAYFIKTIDIPCETDNINFYAREAGFFNNLWPREENKEHQLLYIYFLEHAEKQLEAANGRLTEYRKKLNSWDKQCRELQQL